MEKLQEILEKIYNKSIYLLIAIIFMYIGFKLTDFYVKHLKKDKLLKLEPTAKNFIIKLLRCFCLRDIFSRRLDPSRHTQGDSHLRHQKQYRRTSVTDKRKRDTGCRHQV